MSGTKNILIIAATVLLAVVIFCFGTRYQMVGAAAEHTNDNYIYDRMTGRVWAVNADEYVKVTSQAEKILTDHNFLGLPYEERRKALADVDPNFRGLTPEEQNKVLNRFRQPLQTIAEFRKKYPQYNDVPDQALADRIYNKFYSDMPKDKFMAEVLRKSPPERPLGEP